MFANFSTGDGFKNLQGNRYINKYLTFSLREEDKKTLALHNIPKGYKGKLIEENKAIPLRSNFQDGLDTALSYAGKVFSFATQLSPYGSLFSGVNAAQSINKIIQPSTNGFNIADARGERINPDRKFTYKDTLIHYINKKNVFDNIALQRTIQKIIANNNIVNPM